MRRKNPNGTRPQAAGIQTNRWFAWSRQLADRHKSVPVRRSGPAFMLAMRAGFILRRIERCYYTTRLLSQLNLSINSHFSTWLSPTRQSIFFSSTEKRFLGSPEKRIESFQVRSDVAAAAPMAGNPASPLTILRAALLRAYVAHSNGTETYLRHDLSTSAIDRIFTRLDETIFTRLEETNRKSLSARFENRLSQSHLELVHRITTERQRNEDFRRSPISREHKTYANANSSRSVASVAVESIRTPQAPPAWQQQTPEGWPVNMERLTDQIVRTIDSRIIAHRERTGQVF